MSETLQGPDQQPTDQPLSSVDFSALYKEQNPDAVENVGKANVEAVAGIGSERDVVGFRAQARDLALEAQAPGVSEDESNGKLQSAANMLRGIEQAKSAAKVVEDAAGVRYDKAQDIIDQTKPRS